MLPADDAAHHLAQRGVLVQGDKNSPQVVPVRTLVARRARRELSERQTSLRHLVQSALRQEGLSPKQRVKALQFALVAEREAVALVQFTHLVDRQVGQHQARAYVKRRLVHVRDEQVRLARVGDGKGQILPGSGWIQ